MGIATVTPSQNELDVARQGLRIQLEAANVTITPELDKFLENQTQVIAHYMAWMRYLNKLLAES